MLVIMMALECGHRARRHRAAAGQMPHVTASARTLSDAAGSRMAHRRWRIDRRSDARLGKQNEGEERNNNHDDARKTRSLNSHVAAPVPGVHIYLDCKKPASGSKTSQVSAIH